MGPRLVSRGDSYESACEVLGPYRLQWGRGS